MLLIGVVLFGLDGTEAFDVITEGFDIINEDVLNAVIDYFYSLPTRRKIVKMFEPAEHMIFRILTNFGEVVDVAVCDVQPIWDEGEDD